MSADDTFVEVARMYEKFNIDEECHAEFCGDSIRDAQQVGSVKASVHLAAASGLESEATANASLLKHETAGVATISFTFQNYGGDALRRGSHENPTGLPAIIGPDAPSDPDDAHATIKEMRIARGQVLTDE